MKYLKYREDFLHREYKLDKTKIREQIKSSQMISEAFENDITWGGSLLGRLINSTIRKGKIMVNATRINSLVKQLKTELDSLIPDAQLSSNEEIRVQVEQIKVKFLITEIYNIVQSDKTVAEKKGELVGDGSEDEGLIQVTIGEIEKISDEQLPKKQELIDKLKRFREALLKLNVVSQPVDDVDDDDSDDSETNFYDQTINLLKSVIQLSDDILTKKVTVTKVEVGKEYTDKNGKVCMVISLDHEVERPSKKDGGDGMFFTNDDKIGKKLDSSLVSVIYRDDTTKSYLGSSQLQRVKRLELKIYDGKDTVKDKKSGKVLQNVNASFFYRNESLPIFEADIKDNESHARASWNKVLTTWNKTGIANLVPKIKELIKGSEGGTNAELYKKTIMKLGKQVIANKLTVGANPLKFEELIKEADTAYNDIPKAISLISRVILSFKEDMGLLSAIGDSGKTLKSFITAFGEMDKIYPKLKSKNVEPKKEETPEAKNDSRLFGYSKFLRINEADEETPQPEEDTNEDENKTESNDEVKVEWSKEFKEGEESEWKIDEKQAKDLQKKTDELENKPVEVNADDYYDHIIRIIRIFGKAYDIYATDVIPSGRPNGRVSQKTFREYEYVGDSENDPAWGGDSTAATGGPWAAKLPYNKWQDGVMQILENPKYRKILANIKFTSSAESSTDTKAEKGSGKTLFTFMNDLLNGNGRFSKVRSKVMSDYFNSEENKNRANEERGGQGNPNPQVLEGDPGKAQFMEKDSPKTYFTRENFKAGKMTYKNTFLKILAKVGGQEKQFIIFVVNYVVDSTQKPNHIVIKFHKQEKGAVKQSIISKFLEKRFSTNEAADADNPEDDGKKKLILDTKITNNPNEPVYFGIVEVEPKIFEVSKKTKIKFSLDPINKPVEEIEIEVTKIEVLKYYDEIKKRNIIINISNENIKGYPTGDKSRGLTKLNGRDQIQKFGLSS